MSVLGKTVIFDSLNTKDRQQATTLASARRNEIQQALAQAKARFTRPAGPERRVLLSDEEIQQVCTSYRAKWLAQDEEMRRAGMTDSAAELYSDIIEDYHPAVTKAVARGNISSIADELRLHLCQLGLDIDESTEAYRKLAYAILTTEWRGFCLGRM